MPPIPNPKQPFGPPARGFAPHLGHANGGEFEPTAGTLAPDAVRAWHFVTVAVSHTLPRQLIRAGQLQRASLLALRRRGKVR